MTRYVAQRLDLLWETDDAGVWTLWWPTDSRVRTAPIVPIAISRLTVVVPYGRDDLFYHEVHAWMVKNKLKARSIRQFGTGAGQGVLGYAFAFWAKDKAKAAMFKMLFSA